MFNLKTSTQLKSQKKLLAGNTILGRMRGFSKRFREDNQGIAAIEFCLVAPLMLATYFGLVEISLLIQADRSVTHASSLIGDLTSQGEELTPDMMEDYIYAALSVLDTDLTQSKEKVSIDLYSVEAFDNGSDSDSRETRTIGHASYRPVTTVTIDGSEPDVTAVADSYDSDAISPNLLPVGTGIIVAQVNYDYESPLQIFVKNVSLGETFFLKPRRSVLVPFGDQENDLDDMECSFSSDDDVDCTAIERPEDGSENLG